MDENPVVNKFKEIEATNKVDDSKMYKLIHANPFIDDLITPINENDPFDVKALFAHQQEDAKVSVIHQALHEKDVLLMTQRSIIQNNFNRGD